MSVRWLLGACVVATLSSTSPARAAPPHEVQRITLSGRQDACISERSLRARVAHYLAHSRSQAAVEVTVRRTVDSTEFSVSRAGVVLAQRRFEQLPSACTDRRDALALAIALAIEHAVSSEGSEPAPRGADAPAAGGEGAEAGAPWAEPNARATPSEADTAELARPGADTPEPDQTLPAAGGRASSPGPQDRAPAASERSPLRKRLTQTALLGGARLLLEVLPVPSFAFAAGVELPLLPFFRVQLSGLLSLPAQSDLVDASVRTQLLGGEALGCGSTGFASLNVHGCLGLAGGAVTAQGDGYSEDFGTTLAWMAALVRAALRWSFTALAAVQLTATAHVSMIRPELRLLGSTSAQTSQVVGGSVGLDMIVRFR